MSSYCAERMFNKTPVLISMMLSGFLLVSAREKTPPEVFGLINQSIQLSNYMDLRFPIEKTIWQFTTKERTVKMVEIKNESWKTYFPQFTNRLQIFNNGATLGITHLNMRDNGKFTAEITLTNKQLYKSSFILNVYEPVSEPAILITGQQRSGGWCNASISCSVAANTSVLSYIWKYRHQDTEFQLYNNEKQIQISLQPESWDMELLCVVYNPADQRNISLHIQDICTAPGCSIIIRSVLTAIYLLLCMLCIHLSHCLK